MVKRPQRQGIQLHAQNKIEEHRQKGHLIFTFAKYIHADPGEYDLPAMQYRDTCMTCQRHLFYWSDEPALDSMDHEFETAHG
jgi:hypothetical protein